MKNSLEYKIVSLFIDKFKTKPIVVFSPGRINIIGEHTDYNEGFVFPGAIDKYIVAAIQKSKSELCSIYAYNKDETYQFHLNNIEKAPNGSWKNYVLGVISELQKKGINLKPFNVVFGGDIPGGAGLSSSAALENGIVFGLNEVFQLGLTKREMIFISQKAEHNFVGVKCGIMDQYSSMFGKENHLLFLDCRTVEAKPIYIDFKDFELVLINTNVKHSLSESAYNERRATCEKVSSILEKKSLRDANEEDLLKIKDQISEDDYQKALYVIQEIERTQKAVKAIENEDIIELGKLIYSSHNGLQHQYKVSCDELDFLVDRAKENSHVVGARMMGGGFGGCTINVIAKSETKNFITHVTEKYKEKFNKECSVYLVNLSDGTHLVKHYNENRPAKLYT
ncbi:MAG: galactokinase [Flavobacteriaceae bacterium]|nr:galactokinase [Flavobacteriaceae bacterium]